MTPIKKYIHPRRLKDFLLRAEAAVGPGSAVGIEYNGQLIMGIGPNFETLLVDDPRTQTTKVQFDPLSSGTIRLRLPEGRCPEECGCPGLLQFMGHSLQTMVDMDRACRSVGEEALSKYRELALLHRSVTEFNTSLLMRDVVNALINECRKDSYPGEKCAIFLADPHTGHFRTAGQFGFPVGMSTKAFVDDELFTTAYRSGRGEIVNDLSKDDRWNNELPNIGSIILVPLHSPNRCEGVIIMASVSTGLFEAAHLKNLGTLSSVAGISVSNAFNFEGLQTLMNAILMALAEAIDSRDPFTAGHSERVAQLVTSFAVILDRASELPDVRFTENGLRELYYAGILHDVGKIGIRESVLTKKTRLPEKLMEVIRARLQLYAHQEDFPWREAFERAQKINGAMIPTKDELDFIRDLASRSIQTQDGAIPLLHDDERQSLLLEYGNLTPEERREIERHPAESERILQHIPLQDEFRDMLTIIRQHHERLDGSGYPDGLLADEIMLQSRMMSIVDIYDAVTQKRHYKPARTRREAIEILSTEANLGKLDPQLVEIFTENVERIEQVAERVKLFSGTHIWDMINRLGV